MQTSFVGGVARAIQAWPIALILFGGVIAGIVFMFRILPSSFVPDEDQGYFFVAAQVSDTASLTVTSRFTQQLEKVILADPAVQDLGTVNGYSFIDGQQNNSAAIMFGLLALQSFSQLQQSHVYDPRDPWLGERRPWERDEDDDDSYVRRR